MVNAKQAEEAAALHCIAPHQLPCGRLLVLYLMFSGLDKRRVELRWMLDKIMEAEIGCREASLDG